MLKNRFDKKIVLVVGSNGGIGSALVKSLKCRSAIVIESSSKTDFRVDITSSKEIKRLAKKISKKYKFIDYLFIATGVGYYKNFLSTTDLEIKKVINTNLVGLANLL